MQEQWKCASCRFIGPEEDFRLKLEQPPFRAGAYLCPKEACRSEDVFPHRRYRCLECGHEGVQEDFYGDVPLDIDPADVSDLIASCFECDSSNCVRAN